MSESQSLSQAAPPPAADTDPRGAAAGALFRRLPRWVAETLTPEQKDAIAAAMHEPAWKSHPVDIRVSVPFLKRGYYVTVIGGEEKRSPDRRANDRRRRSIRTAANVLFVTGIGLVFYAAAFLVLALSAAIIEF